MIKNYYQVIFSFK